VAHSPPGRQPAFEPEAAAGRTEADDEIHHGGEDIGFLLTTLAISTRIGRGRIRDALATLGFAQH
jgi:hypothetical protein